MEPEHHKIQKSEKIIANTSIRQLSILYLFPGITLAMVIGNQMWTIGPFYIGQMINWLNMFAAIIIISRKYPIFTLVMTIALCSTKAMAIATNYYNVESVYVFTRCLLFLSAGTYIAIYKPHLIYKQLLILCLINVPIMFFQIAGIGEWLQYLAREDTTGGDYRLVSTLFKTVLEPGWSVIQIRPSGILYSNNRLSQYVLFGFALHFSVLRKYRYSWGTFILCCMAILSMAKIVFLGYMLILLAIFLVGNKHQKRLCTNSICVFIICWLGYAIIFPGLYTNQTEYIMTGHFLFIRINDIISRLPDGLLIKTILVDIFRDTPTADWIPENEDSYVSGYSIIASYLNYATLPMIIVCTTYIKKWKSFKKVTQQYSIMCLLVLIVFVVYPAAVPVWNAPIYWFMGGFTLLPFFKMLYKRSVVSG